MKWWWKGVVRYKKAGGRESARKSGVVYGRRRSAAATASLLPLWLQISTFSSPLAMFNWRDEELLKALFTQGNFFIKYGTYPGETSKSQRCNHHLRY